MQRVGFNPFPRRRRQSAADIQIDTDTYMKGLSHLVLNKNVLARLGPALNSARSLLIYGNAGNGKSAITMSMPSVSTLSDVIPV